MQERPENFNDDDPEGTLVTPRFDAEEARQAHPVVPLAEARPPAPFFNSRGRAGRGLRRSWPPALIAVALLAAAAIGGLIATRVVRRPQSAPAALQAPAAAVQPPAAVAPPQTAEAAPVRQTPPAAETPRETAGTKPEPRAPRVRRVEDASIPARAAAKDLEDENEDRRGKGRGKRRARIEDDGEKEMRRILKDAKKKAPRLVDVLVNP